MIIREIIEFSAFETKLKDIMKYINEKKYKNVSIDHRGSKIVIIGEY